MGVDEEISQGEHRGMTSGSLCGHLRMFFACGRRRHLGSRPW